MLFNSLDFAFFLPIIFALYWLLRKQLKAQNILILIASYVFYAWWDWRFLSLIFLSTVIDYLVGIALDREEKITKRKALLWMSILINLGVLGLFKYYNFFLDNFVSAFSFLGIHFNASSLSIILPIGISFYTFQTLSYSIDVYRRKLPATSDFVAFSAFVSFFPQLVAGPIERATHLLPQFYTKRTFDYGGAINAIRLILWGLFKKVVIADNCAFIVNQVFGNYSEYAGSTLLLGAFFFAFQIYGDFSGYSDIAIGTARLFGFRLNENFARPYFSRDIAEFWRRWHISLTTWFRDYIYIPLGGSQNGKWQSIRNVFVIFLVSGFWHGANWTFIVWGALNAALFVPILLLNKNRRNLNTVAENRVFPSAHEWLAMGFTFATTTLCWILFRADSLSVALSFYKEIFSPSLLTVPYVFGVGFERVALLFVFILVLILVEWIDRHNTSTLYSIHTQSIPKQLLVCYMLAMIIFLFGESQQTFIYFQF